MIGNKERELIDQIISKTQDRLITWEPTAEIDEFLTTFKGQVSFLCRRYTNEYGNAEFTVSVKDQENRELLTANTQDLFANDKQLLAKLYEVAHHSALKYDETLNSLLEDLKKAG